jgi:hypothetical protein
VRHRTQGESMETGNSLQRKMPEMRNHMKSTYLCCDFVKEVV